MKTTLTTTIFLFALSISNMVAQQNTESEKYGKTLNLGVGIGYYGYISSSLPVATINYEFDVAKNITIAPFVSIYSRRYDYYWGNPNKPYYDPSYRAYSRRTTYIPFGAKGTYYFDNLFKADSKWDFYGAVSLGFVYRSVVWENGYGGDRDYYNNNYSRLYLDAHIGAEYHINTKAGLFLDLSTGVSTFGLAIHF